MAYSITVILVSDALFVFLLLFIVGIRNVLGLDAELIGFSVLMFTVKSLLTAGSLYTTMRSWLGVSYFVVDNKLYIQSDVRHISSVIIELKDVHKATAKNSYKFLKKTEYGNVIIDFTKRASGEPVVLQGVSNPQEVANRLVQKA